LATPKPSRLRRLLLASIIVVVAVPLFSAIAADPDGLPPGARAIPHRRDDSARYQNFVVNWDAGTDLLCAVVSTPADYARLFHPAPVIGGKKPFAPPDEAFAKEQLLVVARVVGGDGGSVLEIKRVVEKDGGLEVHVDDRPTTAPATFTVKHAALAWIPLRDAGKVTFVTDGKAITTLDPADGVWIAPPLPEPETAE
jgi:hypothetical protein